MASVSFSSMNVDSDVISGAEKVKMDKLQRRLETAREITFRWANRSSRAVPFGM